jgi:peptidoglycan/xylan/chitin deacetylase (PgdA/CDA1 family)
MRRVLVVGLLLAVLVPMTPAASTAAGPRHRAPAVPCSRGLVALTFDDGPSATVTPRLVRLLRRERVPATFFMIGQHVDTHPEIVRMVDRAGFAIGNHTWAHDDLTTLTGPQVRASIRSTRRALVHAGVEPTSLARPPYGAVDDRVRRVLEGLGYTPVLWSIDPRDWAGASTPQIEARVLGAVRPHRANVVLQHDGVTNSPATLRAVSTEIGQLRRRGFCFADLDAAGQPTPPVPVATVHADVARIAEGGRVRLAVRLDRPTSRPTTVGLTAQGRVSASVVRFRVGQTSARVWLRIPQDRADEHGERAIFGTTGGKGTLPSAARSVRVLDDDPAPVVRADDVTAVASPLIRTVVRVPVRLDRTTDRDVSVLIRTRLGEGRAVIAAGGRAAEAQLTIPVGTPDERVRELPIRIIDAPHATLGAPATLVVRPPAVDRGTAARQALAAVTWPALSVEGLSF